MKKKLKWMIPAALILITAAAFLIYVCIFYRAEPAAEAALQSDETVQAVQTDYGWYFDGPSDDSLLVFYPGAKVEETAYAPLMHRLAGLGLDVCLVKVPFRLAVFAADKADDILGRYDYENLYVGGHSLGGAIAANYAAGHGSALCGVILLGAYPTKPIEDRLTLISIYGSEDGVLNLEKVAEGRSFAPENYSEYVIEGGNHAQFGNYGEQKGDGAGRISAEEQQELTAEYIIRGIR